MPLLNDADAVYLGSSAADKVYLGTNLVWSPTAASGYAAEVLADSPILYWRFEETSGATVADASGNGFDGTVTGADLNLASGFAELGSAAGFNGSDNRIDVADDPLLRPSVFTYDGWFLYGSAPSTFPYVVAKSGNNGTFSRISLNSAKTKLRPAVNTASGLSIFDGATTVSDGNWHHFALTYDGATVQLYVDGSPDGSAAATGAPVYNADPFRVGMNPSVLNANPWQGRIDEIAFYDTALSAARIAAHYNAGIA